MREKSVRERIECVALNVFDFKAEICYDFYLQKEWASLFSFLPS